MLFACAVLLLTAVSGCSHPLEIDVPNGYRGRVIVLCEEFEGAPKPIQVGKDGMARHAGCPRSQTNLVVVRNGTPVRPGSQPHWSVTGDGIILSIDFDLQ